MAFQDNLSFPSVRNDPEEHSSHLLRDVSLKSGINTNKLYLQDSVWTGYHFSIDSTSYAVNSP